MGKSRGDPAREHSREPERRAEPAVRSLDQHGLLEDRPARAEHRQQRQRHRRYILPYVRYLELQSRLRVRWHARRAAARVRAVLSCTDLSADDDARLPAPDWQRRRAVAATDVDAEQR